MIRIRFHGRGGHGVKTASRIVGTAAFLAGYQSQDCPVYGAERRGAAVASFVRIDRQFVRERGVIERPDLIVIGDETLLETSSATVLAGQESASAVFLNAPSADGVAAKFNITAQVLAFDVTAVTLELLEKASALSAGLAAAAARLSGTVTESQLAQAVRDELEHLHVPPETIDRNLLVAQRVFAALPSIAFRPPIAAASEPLHTMQFDDPLRATPSILAPGNAQVRDTGSWRVERPVIDPSVCTRCGLCFVRCPDGAISLDAEGYPVIDYDHCKGCMICWQQCPVGGIEREKEVRAW